MKSKKSFGGTSLIRMEKRHLKAALLIVLFAALAYWADPLLLKFLGLVPLLWIGLPVALFGVVRLLASIRTGGSRESGLALLCAVLKFGCFVALVIPANHFMQERAVAAAKAYPDSVVPLLEAYRDVHGAYPTSLDQVHAAPPLPRLLRSRWGYHSDGKAFTFSFPQPGMFGGWQYHSERMVWHLST
jgi:hypothetical protein